MDRLEKLLPPELRVDDSVRREKGLRIWLYANPNRLEWRFSWSTDVKAYKQGQKRRTQEAGRKPAKKAKVDPAHDKVIVKLEKL